MLEILTRESDSEGGDIDAVDVGMGDGGVEEGVEEERDAACAGAEVEDADGGEWGGVSEEGAGEVGG